MSVTLSVTLGLSSSGESAYVKPELGDVLLALDKIKGEAALEKWSSFSTCLSCYLQTEEKILEVALKVFDGKFNKVGSESTEIFMKRFIIGISKGKGSKLAEVLCQMAEVREILKLAKENERLRNENNNYRQAAIRAAEANLNELSSGQHT